MAEISPPFIDPGKERVMEVAGAAHDVREGFKGFVRGLRERAGLVFRQKEAQARIDALEATAPVKLRAEKVIDTVAKVWPHRAVAALESGVARAEDWAADRVRDTLDYDYGRDAKVIGRAGERKTQKAATVGEGLKEMGRKLKLPSWEPIAKGVRESLGESLRGGAAHWRERVNQHRQYADEVMALADRWEEGEQGMTAAGRAEMTGEQGGVQLLQQQVEDQEAVINGMVQFVRENAQTVGSEFGTQFMSFLQQKMEARGMEMPEPPKVGTPDTLQKQESEE